MTLKQFIQIIFAGRWRLLLCTLACLGGALYFGFGLPPTYEARARVLLELASEDLVTGTQVDTKSTESYVRTQQILAMSERVALRVVEKLGWADNQAVIDAWQGATGGQGDIRIWAARRILAATTAVPLQGGGTMEIVYRAPDPTAATLIAGLLREAYIETTLELQTEGAKRRADRYDELGVETRARLAAAEAAYTELQRATGTVADAAGNDLENGALERLRDQALQAEVLAVQRGQTERASLAAASLSRQIGDLESAIAVAVTTLGPANPQYQSMLARRASLRAALIQASRAAAPIDGVAAGRRIAAEAEAAYREARTRVLARGPDALKLAQAQRTVAILRSDLRRIVSNGATLRMQSERTESGLVVMGDVVTEDEPVAPDIPVIATIAALFGIGLGLVSVVLDGLMRREVLSTDDLVSATGVPILGVVPAGPRGPPGERLAATWHKVRASVAKLRRRPVAV